MKMLFLHLVANYIVQLISVGELSETFLLSQSYFNYSYL